MRLKIYFSFDIYRLMTVIWTQFIKVVVCENVYQRVWSHKAVVNASISWSKCAMNVLMQRSRQHILVICGINTSWGHISINCQIKPIDIALSGFSQERGR